MSVARLTWLSARPKIPPVLAPLGFSFSAQEPTGGRLAVRAMRSLRATRANFLLLREKTRKRPRDRISNYRQGVRLATTRPAHPVLRRGRQESESEIGRTASLRLGRLGS